MPTLASRAGDEADLSSISTIFSLPFLLDVVEQDTLTLRILNFMQVYLTFAVMAISTLLVVALVHVIYLLHENRWIKIRARRVAGILLAAIPCMGDGDRQPRVVAGRRDPWSARVRRVRLVRQHRAAGRAFGLVGHRVHASVGCGGARPLQRAVRGAA